MLVLSRKVGEKIRIGENITIVVTEFYANKVRLGIIAPSDILIMRTELLEGKEEQQDATDSD